MVATLQEGQADLPRLVELASRGEDVLITVDGKPRAKLIKAESSGRTERSPVKQNNLEVWLRDLEELRRKYATGKAGASVEKILEEDRAERL